LSKLSEFESDGLLIIGETNITLTEEGQHFSNLIGSIFDQYLERTPFRKEINIRVITAT
jgi:coproporphyrinogen III oxidase-like Fe-S oxidoreductase